LTTVGQFLSFSKNLSVWFEKKTQNGFGCGSNLFIYLFKIMLLVCGPIFQKIIIFGSVFGSGFEKSDLVPLWF
jgi:hypothetical protein